MIVTDSAVRGTGAGAAKRSLMLKSSVATRGLVVVGWTPAICEQTCTRSVSQSRRNQVKLCRC